ncbi:hypothetical protein MNV49_003850 [Pseudohyphozyma bogoriensis]|nr:hypothetical protein MNV49_003850 [Pseudohyphozyma bogoriensis]
MTFQCSHILANCDDSPSPLPRANVALFGPCLPASSLLHIATAHLRTALALDEPQSPTDLSETARGKQRATPRVLILTPSRDGLLRSLADENDLALSEKRCGAETSRLLESVDIKTLPSPPALTYFLTTAFSHSGHEKPHKAFSESGSSKNTDPSYLPIPPSLVILHNPSDYLKTEDGGSESYTSLLALFVSTFTSLSPSTCVSLLLTDSRLM